MANPALVSVVRTEREQDIDDGDGSFDTIIIASYSITFSAAAGQECDTLIVILDQAHSINVDFYDVSTPEHVQAIEEFLLNNLQEWKSDKFSIDDVDVSFTPDCPQDVKAQWSNLNERLKDDFSEYIDRSCAQEQKRDDN